MSVPDLAPDDDDDNSTEIFTLFPEKSAVSARQKTRKI